MSSIIGESRFHDLYGLRDRREQEVDFMLAKLVLEKYFRQDGTQRTDRPSKHEFDPEVQAWLFPQVLQITRRWRTECVTCKDNAFPQMLLLLQFAHTAADKIYRAIVAAKSGEKILKPILRPYDAVGSTRYVDFDTTRPVYPTDPNKCHVSYVVADTGSWEQKMAQALEEMGEVRRYVKNQGLGFTIPYTLEGEEHNYMPDFIACVELPSPAAGGGGAGGGGLLNLIIEVSGEARKEKAAKVATTRTLWVPAVNNHGGLGRWAFIEITDPWDAKNTIRAMLRGEADESRHYDIVVTTLVVEHAMPYEYRKMTPEERRCAGYHTVIPTWRLLRLASTDVNVRMPTWYGPGSENRKVSADRQAGMTNMINDRLTIMTEILSRFISSFCVRLQTAGALAASMAHR